MRILLINQYLPPDSSPTALLFGRLAEQFEAEGVSVTLVSANQSYAQRSGSKLKRVWRELRALGEMFWRGLRTENVDVVFSGSSPPGVLVVATLLSVLKRARSVHWAMDLYPELAIALGPKLPVWLTGPLFAFTSAGYRYADAVVTLDDDMRAHLRKRYGVSTRVIKPWNLTDLPDLTTAQLEYPQEKPFVWLYSGNLGQAHDWQTLLDAQRLLEADGAPFRLVFQGDGAARAAAAEYAQRASIREVEFLPYAPKDQLVPSLLKAQVMVATQRAAVRGLLWPSKLTLLMALPRPLVFVGPSQGSIAADLRQRGMSGVFEPGDATGVAAYLRQLQAQWPPPTEPRLGAIWRFEQAYPLWREVFDLVGAARVTS
jgi:colanic acid biosynthesis glycosyl transferase WcaI